MHDSNAKGIKNFIIENKNIIIGVFAYTILCFWVMVTQDMVCIDEEQKLLADGFNNSWLEISRYGIWLYERLFTDGGRFVPFFTDIIGLMLWNVSGWIFVYEFTNIIDLGRHKKLFSFLAVAFYSSIPFCVGEIFAFTIMVVPVGMAMVMTALAFCFTIHLNESRRLWKITGIILMLTFSLGVYQNMMNIYITALAGYCLFVALNEEDTNSFKIYFKKLISAAIFAVISVVFYYVISKIVAMNVEQNPYYSEAYVGWSDGVITCLKRTVFNVIAKDFALFKYTKMYGGITTRVVSILFVAAIVYYLIKAKGLFKKLELLFWEAVVMAGPFVLFILLGSVGTPGRTLLGLSLMGMIEILYVAYACRDKLKVVVSAIVGWMLVLNVANMNQLYYAALTAYRHDSQIAKEMISEIQHNYGYVNDKALVTIGMIPYDSPYEGSDSLGGSYFWWEDGKIIRIIDFMKTQGMRFNRPTKEQIESALSLRVEMNTWPLDGSVMETEDCIIIYLSEPTEKWYRVNLGE